MKVFSKVMSVMFVLAFSLFVSCNQDVPEDKKTPEKTINGVEISFGIQDGNFYYYDLEAYKNVKNTNDVIQFTLKNESDTDDDYRIHIADENTKEILERTVLGSGESVTHKLKIEDLIIFWNEVSGRFQLEIFCDTSKISVTEAKILTIEG